MLENRASSDFVLIASCSEAANSLTNSVLPQVTFRRRGPDKPVRIYRDGSAASASSLYLFQIKASSTRKRDQYYAEINNETFHLVIHFMQLKRIF